MAITVYSTSVDTTGSNGSASGSSTIKVLKTGLIEWVYLDFHASAPGATTDTTLSFANTPPGGNVLAVSNSATDALFFPRGAPVNTANSAITNAHTRIAATGDITVTVAQSNALTACVTAYVAISD